MVAFLRHTPLPLLTPLAGVFLYVHRNRRLIRDGEKGVGRWRKREIIYLSLHCHHQNDFCIKMGSDESHFNFS